MRPKYTRRDINHAEVVKDLRDMGMVVWDLADCGGKILDLMVFWRGMAVPVEVKQPGQERNLTEDERASMLELETVGIWPVICVCAEDVKEHIEERYARLEE